MSAKRQVPAGSREEAQIAESILYGLLHGLLTVNGPLIAERFAYEGVELIQTSPADRAAGVVFEGLTIHMASGDYDVVVTRRRAR